MLRCAVLHRDIPMSAAAGVTTPLMSTTADTKSTDPFVAHSHVQSSKHEQHRKVSIVGAGAVGMAIAVSIINQNLCSELTLIDIDTKKVSAEILDLQHGMGAAKMPVVVNGGSDITLTRHSNVCIVAAGVRQRVGESRRDLLNRNAELLAPIIRELARLSPKTILLMVSNPVDVMTYLAWKVSGFPASRVVGSGTTLDSSRFRNLLSKRLNVPVTSAHAYVIGEHGDMSVPVWSSVNVFGTQLRYLYPKAGTPNDPDRFNEISGQIVRSAADLIAAKGYTSWGIGLCCATIVRAFLKDEGTILPLTTIVPGSGFIPGVDQTVAISLPCQLDASGVRSIIKIALDKSETKDLQASALKLIDLQSAMTIPQPKTTTAVAKSKL